MTDSSIPKHYLLVSSTKFSDEEIFDISKFLANFRFLIILSQPFVQVLQFMSDVVRWQNKQLSGALLFGVNFFCLFVPAEYSMTLCLLGLFVLVGLGLLQRKTNIFIKFFPSTHLNENDLYNCVLRDAGNTAELLKEYRKVLFQLNYFFQRSWEYLHDFYYILKWQNIYKSIIYFGCLWMVVIMLHLYDIRWLVFLLTNTLFLAGSDLYSVFMEKHSIPVKSSCIEEQIVEELMDVEESKLQILDTQSEKPDQESEFEEISSAEEDDITDVETKIGHQPANKTSVVKRFLDLKKKHQQAITGNCNNCGINFTMFLKRRHCCTNCGKHFCSRCCSYKVPKAAFGVTAPTAKSEMVLVCSLCNDVLLSKDSL